jgi:hypothetical protein
MLPAQSPQPDYDMNHDGSINVLDLRLENVQSFGILAYHNFFR